MDEEEESWNKPIVELTGKTQSPTSRLNLHNRSLEKDQSAHAQPIHERTIIHIDVDCFYAQVEMIRDPSLRDKPLGIQQKNIVVTCNYVARKYGVTKLMYIKDAKEKCPQLVLVSGEDLTNYREMSYKISEFLNKYTPYVERLGMDENYLDVTDLVNQRKDENNLTVAGHVFGDKHQDKEEDLCTCGCYEQILTGSHIAEEIRAALYKEIGLTCCAGISHNKLLAKLVGEQHKPNQQTTLFSHQVEAFMARLPKARSIPGVGSATAKKLAEFGVVTMTDLQQCPLEDLRRELGDNMAASIKELSQGIDNSPVIPYSKPQTLSDEDSFKSCCSVKEANQKIKELIKSLMIRLVEDGRIAGTVRLTIRRLSAENKYLNRESKQCNIPSHVLSKLTKENQQQTCGKLEVIVMNLFNKLVDIRMPFHLTLINVAFCNLIERNKNSISHFFSPKKDKNNHRALNNNTDSCLNESKSNNKTVCSEELTCTASQMDKECSSSRFATSTDHNLNNSRKLDVSNMPTANTPILLDTISIESPRNKNSVICQSSTKRKSLPESGFFSKRLKRAPSEASQSLSPDQLGSQSVNPDQLGFKASQSVNPDQLDYIDAEVFSLLPPDIQKEIKEARSKFPPSTNSVNGEMESVSIKSEHQHEKHCGTESLCEKPCTDQPGGSNDTDFKSNTPVTETVTASFVPAGYDRDVFLSLPTNIQEELLKEEESKAEWAYVKQAKNSVRNQQTTKTQSTKTAKSNNLLSYFKRSK
ncbi:DNA polymerase iota-like [Saccostrea echinata]|uniref:DNA polymerase iota-like n=1 Tax=Saccostrea echinata TaxID=191078 RepID=UPI002A8347B8|nr:DNA polymerase iota-like [Saccostrea echinata]